MPDARALALTACSVDLVVGSVHRDGASVALTTREADLLRYLVANPNRVVGRDEILSEVFGYADDVVSRACDNTVRRLRAKIEADPARPAHLLTVHGTGYRFVLGGDPGGTEAIGLPVPEERPLVAVGPLRVDLARRRLIRPDAEVDLTEPEAALLEALIRADGRVVDRRTLLRAAWVDRASVGQRLLDNTMSGLRAKLEPDPTAPRRLHTARGTGYRLERAADPADDPDLVGRQTLVRTVWGAVGEAPWVLLVGPAGVGKSRLARAVSARVDRSVAWVDGAAARTIEDGATALALALGIPSDGGDPLEAVRRGLAGRRALVILDDLERAPTAFAALVARLLPASPDVRWLGTSRVRLGVPGERVIEVDPLDADGAAELFVRRVAAASPGTAPLDPRTPAIRTLVERLEGMPLAIELAAPRLRVLTADQLLARLDIDLLARPPQLDRRHDSLRAAIGASLDALPAQAVDALARIALFERGLFVDDAEGLIGDDAVDLLQILRDHSLVHLVPDDTGPRFAAWQAVRELLAADRVEDLVRQHCAWLGRRGDLDHAPETPEDAARHRALVDEDVAATRRAVALGDGPLAARCAVAALWTLLGRGPFALATALVDEVLVLSVPPTLRGVLLVYRGTLELRRGALADAAVTLGAAAALGAEHGSAMVEMNACAGLSHLAEGTGDPSARRSWLVRAADAGERGGLPRALVHRGEIALADGDWAAAEAAYREAQRVVRSPSMRSTVLQALGALARRGGRVDEARAHLEQARDLLDQHGNLLGQRSLLQDLAALAHEAGDLALQERWLAMALDIAEETPVGSLDGYTHALRARARLWAGRPVDAAQDLAIAESLARDGLARAKVAEIRAEWCWLAGDPAGALEIATRAVAELTALGETTDAAHAERHLARARMELGDPDAARRHAEHAWAGVIARGLPYAVAVVAGALAEVIPADRATWVARAAAAHPVDPGAPNELGTVVRRLAG